MSLFKKRKKETLPSIPRYRIVCRTVGQDKNNLYCTHPSEDYDSMRAGLDVLVATLPSVTTIELDGSVIMVDKIISLEVSKVAPRISGLGPPL